MHLMPYPRYRNRCNRAMFRVAAIFILVGIAAGISPALRTGEAFVYHAWEPYQFPGWRGNMEVVSSPYKPTHFVGDYGHLRYRVFLAGPLHVPRGIPVEIARILA